MAPETKRLKTYSIRLYGRKGLIKSSQYSKASSFSLYYGKTFKGTWDFYDKRYPVAVKRNLIKEIIAEIEEARILRNLSRRKKPVRLILPKKVPVTKLPERTRIVDNRYFVTTKLKKAISKREMVINHLSQRFITYFDQMNIEPKNPEQMSKLISTLEEDYTREFKIVLSNLKKRKSPYLNRFIFKIFTPEYGANDQQFKRLLMAKFPNTYNNQVYIEDFKALDFIIEEEKRNGIPTGQILVYEIVDLEISEEDINATGYGFSVVRTEVHDIEEIIELFRVTIKAWFEVLDTYIKRQYTKAMTVSGFMIEHKISEEPYQE